MIKNDGTPHKFTITDSTLRDVSRKIFEAIKPRIFLTVSVETIASVFPKEASIFKTQGTIGLNVLLNQNTNII